MQQVHVFVSGQVQGVGYRQFVKSQAKRLGLTGWITNLSDGRVEAVIQGDKEKIAVLVSICQQGPMLAEVKDMSITWEESTESFTEFLIKK